MINKVIYVYIRSCKYVDRYWYWIHNFDNTSQERGTLLVAQLVESLHYKPEGRGFDFRCVIGTFYWNNPCALTMALGSTPPVTEMSTRNISWGWRGGGKGGWCLGLTTLPPTWADFLEIWEPQPLGTLRAYKRPVQTALPCFTLSEITHRSSLMVEWMII